MSQLQVTGEAKIRDIQGPVVANSGVITALDGAASQYVRGDGTLADFPTSTGGGSSVSYYLNSSVSQGTIDGNAYRELSKDPIIGTGTDIAISSNGYVANYITDANDPDVVIVPGGNFNCEFYFSVNNNTGSPTTYAELYKYDGSTFTLLGSSSGVPESINQGTTIAPYYFAIPVATATLATTDRLAIRIYVNVDGRTVTLHTENSHLCQVVTTLSKGMVSLNNLTDQSQYLTTGTSGTNFNIASSGDTHTFNLPVASATNTGKLSSTDWSTFNGKVPYTGANNDVDLGLYNLNAQHLFANGLSGINSGNLLIYQGPDFALSSGYTTIYSNGNNIGFVSNPSGSTTYNALFDLSSLSATRTFTLPNLSGTLALTSDLSNYVPYTGATASVELGSYGLTASGVSAYNLFATGIGTQGGYLYLKKGSSPYSILVGSNSITAEDSKFILMSDAGSSNYKLANIDLGLLTNNTARTYTLPDLSGTLALLEGAQTFSGAKTFSATTLLNTIYVDGVSYLKHQTTTSYIAGYTTFNAKANGVIEYFFPSSFKSILDFNDAADYTYTFPASSGTLALTSDLSSYVPYTGASGNVDLGANNLVAKHLIVNGVSGSYGGSLLMKQNANAGLSNNYTSISSSGLNFVATAVDGAGVLYEATFNLASITTNRSYTLPNASGTIALTSNLSSYVPYTGATGNLDLGNNHYYGGSILLKQSIGSVSATGYFSLSGSTGTGVGSLILGLGSGTTSSMNFPTSSNYSYVFPATSGTLALTSDLGSYVTLATTQTISGFKTFTALATNNEAVGIKLTSGVVSTGGYLTLNAKVVGTLHSLFLAPDSSTNRAEITFDNTALRTYALQNASGTIALLSGTQTFTGATTFSSTITANSGVSGGAIILNSATNYGLIQDANSVSRIWFENTGSYRTLFDLPASGTAFVFRNSSGTIGATITAAGAATFSANIRSNTYISAIRAASDSGGAGPYLEVSDNTNSYQWQMGTSNKLHLFNYNGGFVGPFITVNGSGNVGIGTSSPSYKLDVRGAYDANGIITVRSTDSAAINVGGVLGFGGFHNGSSNQSQWAWIKGAKENSNVNDNASYLAFATMTSGGSPTERMRITSGGKLLVRTTTSTGGAGGDRVIELDGNIYSKGTDAGYFWTDRSNASNFYGWYTTSNTIYLFNGTANAASINPATGIYTPLSDINKKKDFEESTIGLNAILGLKPTLYRMKTDNESVEKQLGFIAQEVKEFIPQAFVESGEGDNKFIGLNDRPIIAALVKAIQEQNEIITKQGQAIEELKALIAAK